MNGTQKAELNEMLKLCFLDQELLKKYSAKKKVMDTITLIVCCIWLGGILLLGLTQPEEKLNELFFPLFFGFILPCLLFLVGIQFVWSIQKNKLLALNESRLPNDEQGNLRRRLIGLLRVYYKRFTPIVAAVYLVVMACIFIMGYFWGESILFIIFSLSLLVIPLAPTLFFSMRFIRELREVRDKIRLNNTPYTDVENNPYKQSDVYKP